MSLPEAKLEIFGLIQLGKENFKSPSIESVMWFLVLILMKIYNGKKQVEKEKI